MGSCTMNKRNYLSIFNPLYPSQLSPTVRIIDHSSGRVQILGKITLLKLYFGLKKWLLFLYVCGMLYIIFSRPTVILYFDIRCSAAWEGRRRSIAHHAQCGCQQVYLCPILLSSRLLSAKHSTFPLAEDIFYESYPLYDYNASDFLQFFESSPNPCNKF